MTPAPPVSRPPVGRQRAWGLLLAASLLLMSLAGAGAHAFAQAGASDWMEPVNLSHSGTASRPRIVVSADGTLRVLWWDEFEGLMVANGGAPLMLATDSVTGESEPDSAVWSDPAPAPILFPEITQEGGQQVTVQTAIEVMPHILGDAAGRAHALWLGNPNQESGEQPLHYSRLAPSQISWSRPLTLAVSAAAFDVAADISGTLHLAYVRPTQTGSLASGLYYRRSGDGGASWSAPTPIQQSRYLRLLPPGKDALRLTADDANNLIVTWQDPHQGQILVIESTDGGATWQGPRPLVASDTVPLRHRAMAVPDRSDRLLWPLPERPGSRMTVSSDGDSLALARWDGGEWAATRLVSLGFQGPGRGSGIRLGDLCLAFAPSFPDPEEAGGALAVVGIDPQGDLWITGIAVEALSGFLALPSGSPANGEAADESGVVNLSHSGAASNPALVAGREGRLRAFWWDQFDGLTISDGVISASSVTSGTEEIVTVHHAWSEPRHVPLPATTTPRILSDVDGRIHALWLQMPALPAAGQEVPLPLLYSQLTLDGTTWSTPGVLAESALVYDVAADRSSALHLAYILTQQTSGFSAGLYYRRTGEDGSSWSAPTLVYTSYYLRLLALENAHLRLAVDGAGGVYLTWDDPGLEQALLAYSPDGGATWQTPVELGDPEAGSRRGRLITPQDGEVLVLWESSEAGATCHLLQVPVDTLLHGPGSSGQRALDDLSYCPRDERFYPLAEGQVLMMAGAGGKALALALWDGEDWSEPASWGVSFEDAETDRMVYLEDLQAALVQVPVSGASSATAGMLVALGTDVAGDLWVTGSQMHDVEIIFTPPSPWSTPVSISQGDAYPGPPAPAVDAQGWLHVVWSEAASAQEPGDTLFYARWDGIQWSQPAGIVSSLNGKADQPALVALGNRLHMVWSGGASGEILYSSAFANDAYAVGGWSEPALLPAPSVVGSRPHIATGTDGTLHVVYAVPLNEGRGIYYTNSGDSGQTWSPARQLFDAAAEGWLAADLARVLVDAQGMLHVAWVRNSLPGGGPPQGVYYANSSDDGKTWSKPIEIAAGPYSWPLMVSSEAGPVHLIWHETHGQPAWWYRSSSDRGQTWSRQERLPGLQAMSAPASLLADGSGALYLAGLGVNAEEKPALLLSTWNGQFWSAPEISRLDMDVVEPGIAATIQSALGEIQVLFCGQVDLGQVELGEEAAQPQIWHAGRQLPTVTVTSLPAVAPTPTVTPDPTPEPTATPGLTPGFSAAPPPTGQSSLPIPVPVLAAGGLSALIVAGVLGGRLLWTRRR